MKRSKKRNASAAVRLSVTPSSHAPGRHRARSLQGLPARDPWPSAEWKSAFRRRLLAWFRKHSRSLPWRETRDPYPIWVSEVMLQQTQVATVLPYYQRFLARFPTLTDLAAADEHDVLRLWEGLGYYRRARQMHSAAKRITAEHGARFPSDAESVRRLPGIGRYTSGAILSFAFDAREPILEANTLRLFARLLAFRGDPRGAAGQKVLWAGAELILPTRGSGAINQALMELGSQICTPRQPRCSVCPVASLCATHDAGLQNVIPRPKAKPRIEQVREAAVVVRNGRRILLIQRAEGERWAGLWDFPRFAVTNGAESLAEHLTMSLAVACSINIEIGRPLATIRHGVTRFRITLDVLAAELRKGQLDVEGANGQRHRRTRDGHSKQQFAQQRWVHLEDLSSYPLSTTGRKIARLLGST